MKHRNHTSEALREACLRGEEAVAALNAASADAAASTSEEVEYLTRSVRRISKPGSRCSSAL